MKQVKEKTFLRRQVEGFGKGGQRHRQEGQAANEVNAVRLYLQQAERLGNQLGPFVVFVTPAENELRVEPLGVVSQTHGVLVTGLENVLAEPLQHALLAVVIVNLVRPLAAVDAYREVVDLAVFAQVAELHFIPLSSQSQGFWYYHKVKKKTNLLRVGVDHHVVSLLVAGGVHDHGFLGGLEVVANKGCRLVAFFRVLYRLQVAGVVLHVAHFSAGAALALVAHVVLASIAVHTEGFVALLTLSHDLTGVRPVGSGSLQMPGEAPLVDHVTVAVAAEHAGLAVDDDAGGNLVASATAAAAGGVTVLGGVGDQTFFAP